MAVLAAACTGGGDPVSTTARPTTTGAATTSATTDTTTPPTTVPPTTVSPTTTLPELRELAYETVASGLPFPTLLTHRPIDGATFIVTKDGRIWFLFEDGVHPEPFLDWRDAVRNSGEQGMLGMAWHPTDPGRFFIHYSDTAGDTVLAEMAVGLEGDAYPDSLRVLLQVDQPAPNHNGGSLTFGPDGYLYLALGDGGGAGDSYGNGQSSDDLLGSVLRLDVDSSEEGYAIPPDNPFAESGGAPEVWSIGLRNPWRIWFDEGLLYIGDVGQGAYEEIDVVPAAEGGLNFGWPITEGLHCFSPSSGCDVTGIELPVVEVSHADAGTCSVTGGVVYRGSAIPELDGHYFYSDYCGGWLRSFRYLNGEATEQTDWTDQVGLPGRVTSFGVGGDGEMYVTTTEDVVRVVAVRSEG